MAGKLLAIRKKLGLSQTQMAKHLQLRKAYTVISSYERGTREPDLLTLLVMRDLQRFRLRRS